MAIYEKTDATSVDGGVTFSCVDSVAFPEDLQVNTNGFLIAPIVLAKAGVLSYAFKEIPKKISSKLERKEFYRVLKSKETLSNDSVIRSFDNVPIVDEHPNGAITVADKQGKSILGFIREPYWDDSTNELKGKGVFFTLQGLQTLHEKKSVSIGFDFDLALSKDSDVDFEQKSIKCNHVALTSHPRCSKTRVMGLDSSNLDGEEKVTNSTEQTPTEETPVTMSNMAPTFIDYRGKKIYPGDLEKFIEEEKLQALQKQEADLQEKFKKESVEKLSIIEQAKNLTQKPVDVDKDITTIQAAALDSVMKDNAFVQKLIKGICGDEGIHTKDVTKLRTAFSSVCETQDEWKKKTGPMAKDSGNKLKEMFSELGKNNDKSDHDLGLFFAHKAKYHYEKYNDDRRS